MRLNRFSRCLYSGVEMYSGLCFAGRIAKIYALLVPFYVALKDGTILVRHAAALKLRFDFNTPVA